MKTFIEGIKQFDANKEISDIYKNKSGIITITGCLDASKPHLAYVLDKEKRHKLIVLSEEQKAKEEQRIAEAKAESKRKSEQRKKDVAVGLKKEHIGQQTATIPESVESTYYELKQEEIKFSGIAKKLGLSYSITKTDDTKLQPKKAAAPYDAPKP